MKKFSEMSDKELMDEVCSCKPECSVYSFGSRNTLNAGACARELHSRGFDIAKQTSYALEKDGVTVNAFDKNGKAIVGD